MITLYVVENCPKCKVLKQKLTNANIDFTVSQDVKKLIANKILNAPVLEIDSKFLDFSESIQWIKEQQN